MELRLQKPELPVIGAGKEFTVTITVLAHPVTGSVYDIFVVPTVTLVTSPVGSIVATPDAVLYQVPPVLVVASNVVAPKHTAGFPVIGAGSGLTVTKVDLTQPVPIV